MSTCIDDSGGCADHRSVQREASEVSAQHSPSSAFSSEPDPCRPSCRRILVVDDNIDAAKSMAKVLTLLHGQNVMLLMMVPRRCKQPRVFILRSSCWTLACLECPDTKSHSGCAANHGFEGCLLVAVTGWGQEKDRATSRAAGFDHHLVKPVDQATLRSLLDGKL